MHFVIIGTGMSGAITGGGYNSTRFEKPDTSAPTPIANGRLSLFLGASSVKIHKEQPRETPGFHPCHQQLLKLSSSRYTCLTKDDADFHVLVALPS